MKKSRQGTDISCPPPACKIEILREENEWMRKPWKKEKT